MARPKGSRTGRCQCCSHPERVRIADIDWEIVSRHVGFAVFFQGWADWSDGAGECGLAEMRRGIAVFREQGNVYLVSTFKAALAEAEASAGETDVGLQRLDDALAEAERTEQRWCEAEMRRIRGEILLNRDPADTAAA